MHKKIPKICTGCRVSEAKIYLYHNTEIAKARAHSEEWQTDTSVQKQWSMNKYISMFSVRHLFANSFKGLYVSSVCVQKIVMFSNPCIKQILAEPQK